MRNSTDSHSEDRVRAACRCPKQEMEEKLMIIESYAITYPGTMMIHLEIAGIAS